MLEVSDLNAGYGEIQVNWGVSIKIEAGEIVALVGANGAGKSTMIKAIAGLIRVWSGRITFQGRPLENLRCHKIITHGLALVPEGRRLFPYMTVAENLELGAYTEKSREKVHENMVWVHQLFPRLKEREKQLAGTLSGGEQQMVTIGRALMSRPKFLIMDEPSLGLAPLIVDSVFEAIMTLKKEGMTILLVEQNIRKSLGIAQRGYVLEHGRVVLSGDSRSLLADENIKKAYLGL